MKGSSVGMPRSPDGYRVDQTCLCANWSVHLFGRLHNYDDCLPIFFSEVYFPAFGIASERYDDDGCGWFPHISSSPERKRIMVVLCMPIYPVSEVQEASDAFRPSGFSARQCAEALESDPLREVRRILRT